MVLGLWSSLCLTCTSSCDGTRSHEWRFWICDGVSCIRVCVCVRVSVCVCTDEQKQLMAAKDSYDELEQLEEKKEKARLRREEKRDHKSKSGDADKTLPVRHKTDSATDEKALKIKDAEKRAHILSERQSTFLSGLFSTKSPWDTSKGLRS